MEYLIFFFLGLAFFVTAIYVLIHREPPVIINPINSPCDVFELSELPESYRDAIEQGCFKVGGEKKVRYRHTASGNYYAGKWHDTITGAVKELRGNIIEHLIRTITGWLTSEVSKERKCIEYKYAWPCGASDVNAIWNNVVTEFLHNPEFFSRLRDLDCAHNMSDDELVAYHVKNMKGTV